MFQLFEQYMLSKGDFSRSEVLMIESAAERKTLRRRQFLLSEGKVCRHKAFVVTGLLRTYRLKEDGTEYVMRFSPENSWSLDPESYLGETPSQFYIEALEDTEVLTWTREQMSRLMVSVPLLYQFTARIQQQSIKESQRRILANISYSAGEKYQEFLDTHPEVCNRVPLHMVASYLGVSRETLSRVRHMRMAGLKGRSA